MECRGHTVCYDLRYSAFRGPQHVSSLQKDSHSELQDSFACVSIWQVDAEGITDKCSRPF